MKVRTNVLAWIGIVLAVLGMGAILISSISKWFVLIPVVVLVAALVALLKGVTFGGIGKVRWALVAAWILAAIFAICTVLVAVLFGWLALLPFVLLCGTVTWLVYLLRRTVIWIPIIALAIAIILLGVYCIMGSFMRDWNKAVDTLTVKQLIVEGDANVEGDTNIKGDANVEGDTNIKGDANVEGNANIKGDANVEGNANIKGDANVEGNANIKGDANVEGDANIKGDANVEGNANIKGDANVDGNINSNNDNNGGNTTSKPNDTTSKPTHNHSYTKKVVEPTCTSKGYTTYTCSCGHSYTDSEKPAMGHSYTSKVVAPTTTAQGYTIHTCNRCGHSYKDSYTDKLQPVVTPAIKCVGTIRYGETLYVNLEGISASNIKVSNRSFVSVETVSNSRIAVTLIEDVDGYLTITDSASGTNVVIDII